MGARKGWFEKMLAIDRSERRQAYRFFAYRLRDASVQQNPVRDISLTGAFVVTTERPSPGSVLLLTMQQDGPFESSSTRRITSYARVIRVGQDGIGVEFIPASEGHGWTEMIDRVAEHANPREMLAFLRISHGIRFLSRICPRSSEEFDQLFRGRLASHKIASAMAIALHAEALLASSCDLDRLSADAALLCRILEVGSCSEEESLHKDWAGLFAVSCRVEGSTESDLYFVDLLSQLTGPQIRMLTLICSRTKKQLGVGGKLLAATTPFAAEELAFGVSLREAQIERDLEILCDLGLLKRGASDSRTLRFCDTVDLVPTPLALELHSRCRGHRGAFEAFYV